MVAKPGFQRERHLRPEHTQDIAEDLELLRTEQLAAGIGNLLRSEASSRQAARR
jgi:hypothetical protein